MRFRCGVALGMGFAKRIDTAADQVQILTRGAQGCVIGSLALEAAANLQHVMPEARIAGDDRCERVIDGRVGPAGRQRSAMTLPPLRMMTRPRAATASALHADCCARRPASRPAPVQTAGGHPRQDPAPRSALRRRALRDPSRFRGQKRRLSATWSGNLACLRWIEGIDAPAASARR